MSQLHQRNVRNSQNEEDPNLRSSLSSSSNNSNKEKKDRLKKSVAFSPDEKTQVKLRDAAKNVLSQSQQNLLSKSYSNLYNIVNTPTSSSIKHGSYDMTWILKLGSLLTSGVPTNPKTEDDLRELVRRGILLCFGVAASTMGCIWSLSYGYNSIWNFYNVIASIFPLLYSVFSTASVLYFIVSKNTERFIFYQLLMLSLFPILTELALVATYSQFDNSVSNWAFLAPFGALIFAPEHSLKFHAVFCISKLLSVPFQIRMYFYTNPLSHIMDGANSVLLFSLVFVVIYHYLTALRESRSKLHHINSFLTVHNKSLQGEAEELRNLLKKKSEQSLAELAVSVNSPAEKIIIIMQKLKTLDVFGDCIEDIDFVISQLGAGNKDLYLPDIAPLVENSMKSIDNDTKSLLMYHNTQMQRSFSTLPLSKSGSGELLSGSSKPIDFSRSDDDINIAAEVAKMIETWNCDTFKLNTITKGKSLYYVGKALFAKYDLQTKFGIDNITLKNCLSSFGNGYHPNDYHNAIHATDVLISLHFLLSHTTIMKYLTDIDIFAALLAAMIHDVDHPGVNNNFEINTASNKARLYNDSSVLENHHLATGFAIMSLPENNIFKSVSKETYKQVRAVMIDMVLATDFSKHLELLGQFKSRRAAGNFPTDKPEDRVLMLKMALKCADIGHTAKSRELHLLWTQRVTEEFFKQGDQEKSHGLPVSPFMDRGSANIPKSQSGFLNFLVLPLYKAFTEEFPSAEICLHQLESNLNYWREEEQKAEQQQLAQQQPTQT